MTPFHELPDDILCVIFQQTDLSTLFALQLVCKPVHDFIRVYISSIAPAVASNTFLDTAPALLQRPPRYDLQWLAGLIPRYLATVIIDRYGLHSDDEEQTSRRIPATVKAGEKFRERVANGFHVMMKLSLISKKIYSTPRDMVAAELRNSKEAQRKHSVSWSNTKLGSITTKTRESAPLRPLLSQYHYAPRIKPKTEQKENSKHIKTLEKFEAVILQRRKDYLLSVPQEDIEDFRLMFPVFTACFRANQDGTPYPHPFKPDFFDWGGGCDSRGHRVNSGDSWVNWFILHEGPLVFWKQWCPPKLYSDDRKSLIRNLLLKYWDERGYRQIEAETNAAQAVERIFRSKTGVVAIGGPPGRSTDPIPYFSEYLMEEHGEQRTEENLAVDETLDDVPYFIDFQGNPLLRLHMVNHIVK
jgi:hypothetical protein